MPRLETPAAAPRFEAQGRSRTVFNAIAWSSLLFAVLQSICTFFAALNGLRIGLGISSLLLAATTAARIDSFHADWLRIPMVTLALLGSILNLLVIWQIRRLRNRPAAQWRRSPSTPAKIGSERLQMVLALLTLVLIFLEERQHLIWLHHL